MLFTFRKFSTSMHEQSSIRRRLSRTFKFRFWSFLLLVLISAIAIFLLDPLKAVGKESNYTIHTTQDFNQPQFYPISQKVPSVLYRPVGNWVGRLVLPGKEAIQAGTDWAWMEVQFAPKEAQNLVGKVVRLEWKNKPELQSYSRHKKKFSKWNCPSVSSGWSDESRTATVTRWGQTK
jgi:predicted Abi (CAAX) family protease